jgi:hypothetical protein
MDDKWFLEENRREYVGWIKWLKTVSDGRFIDVLKEEG